MPKGLRVDDACEIVEGSEQRIVVAELAELVDHLTELKLGFLQSGPAFGRDFDTHSASVNLVGNPSQSSFLLQASHDGGQCGALDGCARGEFSGALGAVAKKEEQAVLGETDLGISADLFEYTTHNGNGSDRSGQANVGGFSGTLGGRGGIVRNVVLAVRHHRQSLSDDRASGRTPELLYFRCEGA